MKGDSADVNVTLHEYVGFSGTAWFIQNAGSHDLSTSSALVMGMGSGSYGYYQMLGGTLGTGFLTVGADGTAWCVDHEDD